jgi:hypothetical protein
MAHQSRQDVATTLALGTELVATVTEEAGPWRWRATADALPEGWAAIVRTRGDSAPPAGPTTYWIFGVDEKKHLAYLSDSDFGRLPISDRMRPRYASALANILHILSEEGEAPGSPLAPSISEVKGMINRCLRKDQTGDGCDRRWGLGPAPPCSARRGRGGRRGGSQRTPRAGGSRAVWGSARGCAR